MTNEEKAREILKCDKCCFRNKPECNECFDKKAVIEMAQWKDEQIMEKTCNWLEGIAESTGYDSYDVIESYKKAMEE